MAEKDRVEYEYVTVLNSKLMTFKEMRIECFSILKGTNTKQCLKLYFFSFFSFEYLAYLTIMLPVMSL